MVPVQPWTKEKALHTAIPFLCQLMADAASGCAGIFDGTLQVVSLDNNAMDASQTPGVFCWAMLKRA